MDNAEQLKSLICNTFCLQRRPCKQKDGEHDSDNVYTLKTCAILFFSDTQTDEKALIKGCQAVRVQKREAI